MGCDIHAVIEYERHGSYSDFAEVTIPRDYKLFSAIAFGDGGITDGLPYPPRGIPSDHGLKVAERFFTTAEEWKKDSVETGDEDEFDPEEVAKGWGDWAVSEYASCGSLPGLYLHTPSWLFLAEIKTALGRADYDMDQLSPEFRAVLSAMQILSETYGSEKVRLIFWFDG